MKHLLALIFTLFIATSMCLAQEYSDTNFEHGSENNARPTLYGSLFLRKDVTNPQYEAGDMLLKASKFKTASLVFAAASGGVWLFHNEDSKDIVKGTSILCGTVAALLYVGSLRYEWLAGKYLKMSASPGGVTACITF